MSFTQSHEMEGSLEECLREISVALGHLNYEVNGNGIVVRDAGRRVEIGLVYEGDRHLGSLNLPMSKVDYNFIGYTQEEMDAFMAKMNKHLLRAGGG